MTSNHVIIPALALLLSGAVACGPSHSAADAFDSVSVDGFVISNDMSNLRVTAISEDDCGHIWFGTFRGLNKYTGLEYHQYFCTDDTLSIPDNQITDLHRDARGRLWVGTVNGISEYTHEDKFVRHKLESYSNNIAQIVESPSGRIFVNTIISLCALNPETGVFDCVLPVISTENAWNDRCFFSPSGELWIVNSNTIRSFNPDTMEMRDSLSTGAYYSCFEMSPDGMILMGGAGRMAIFSTSARKLVETPTLISRNPVLSKAEITHFHHYGENSVIIVTRHHGCFLYNRLRGTLLHQSDANFPLEMPDFRINTFFTDSQQNVWIGSYDQGYDVLYTYKSRFNNNSKLRRATENGSVLAVDCDSRRNMFISSTSRGLLVYNPDCNEIRSVDHGQLFSGSDGKSVEINVVYVDSKDEIILCSRNELLRCAYSENDGMRVLERHEMFYPLTVAEDSSGNLWVGTPSGYLMFLPADRSTVSACTPFTSDYTFVSSILPFGDEVLVAAFGQPLMVATPGSTQLRRANLNMDDWTACIRRSVFVPSDMLQDSHGDIWIGTLANGLLLYDPVSGHVRPVEGVPCTDISSIEEDRNGNIWISTQYGMGMYDRSADKFVNWFATDGTGGNQFYDRASCVTTNGSIIFGGTHGLTAFNPLDMSYKRNVPVCFENLKVHNNSVKAGRGSIDKALPYGPSIRLNHNQNSFSISFAALDYGEYERVRYFYMLDGFDGHWIDAHNNREAYYANIPYGNFKFKVRVTNYDQSVVLGENSISLQMRRPWWLSWWARVLYSLLGLAAIGAGLSIRHNIMEEKKGKREAEEEKERERKLNELNMTYFANISHEFRTPLTMISGPVAQLSESKDISPEHKRLLDIVTRNVRRMLGLVNQLMDFNKLQNGKLKLQIRKFDLIPQLIYIAEIYSVTAKEKGINFRTYGIEDSLHVAGDPDKLEKICFNLLSNALKFTPGGGTVEFCLDVVSRDEACRLFGPELVNAPRWVKIQVKDTGPGIPEADLEKIFERYYQIENLQNRVQSWGTGIGLYFARALAEMCHGRLKADNRKECRGAVFTFAVPADLAEIEGVSAAEQAVSPAVSFTGSAISAEAVVYSQKQTPEEGKYKILIVDDDADVAYYLRELLAPQYKVVVRFNADDAYKAMKEELPDIVISDVVMPGKSGYEFCRQVKDDIQLSHIPVVLLTAKATVENQVEGLGCGADAYVTKPFEPKYLLAVLASQLSNREKLRQLLLQSTEVEKTASEALTPQDSAFMEEFYRLMEQELSNAELDVARMTEMLHISRTKFYYKVKGLTGYNPGAFFKRYKLNRAAELLKEKKYNVSEIADMTGFSTLSHFSVSFKKQFGMSPSDYLRN